MEAPLLAICSAISRPIEVWRPSGAPVIVDALVDNWWRGSSAPAVPGAALSNAAGEARLVSATWRRGTARGSWRERGRKPGEGDSWRGMTPPGGHDSWQHRTPAGRGVVGWRGGTIGREGGKMKGCLLFLAGEAAVLPLGAVARWLIKPSHESPGGGVDYFM
jgi:hypothetical protein